MMFSKKSKRIGRHSVNTDDSLDLDITSLLDVLVILVIFLIKTYSSSDFTIDLVSDLNLPYSESIQESRKLPDVQVTQLKEVWLDGEKIGSYQQGNEVEKILIARLLERIKEFKAPSEINLLVDKSLEYEFVQLIMNACAITGFTKFRFVVEGSD